MIQSAQLFGHYPMAKSNPSMMALMQENHTTR